MNHILFSSKMKLADMLLANYKLLLVLNRFDIHLGFGEKSIEEVCNKRGIPTSLFLLVCNVYSFSDYLPPKDKLQSFNAKDLIQYLHSSHAYYKEKSIPEINKKLTAIVTRINSKAALMLQRFYDDYQTEVLNHFNYEETVAFPYVDSLLNGNICKEYSISKFEENHSNIEEKLNDLKNIIIKYLPDADSPEELNDLLINLFELEDDLEKHTLIEDKILIPIVSQLELRK